MFSSRTNWNASPNELSMLLAEKRFNGESIVDLTQSNPTQCGFSYLQKEILTALTDDSVLSYRPEPRGLLSARIAITEFYAQNRVSIAPENIILTSSTSESYSFLFKLLCDVNDEIIVPQPGYPLLDYIHQLDNVKLSYFRLLYDGEWRIDFASLIAAITNKTRAVVLVNPNNPTGSFIKKDEYEKICSLAIENNFAIIADEVFASYSFSPNNNRANILAVQSDIPVFLLNGISKLLGLPQLKLSWIVVAGNPDKRIETLNRLDIIADTYLSVNTPVQVALPKLFKHLNFIGEQILGRIQGNYHLLQKTFINSSVSVLNTEGGWYAILKLPQIKSDEEWAYETLKNMNIFVHPGYYFNIDYKSCLVVGLLLPTSSFEKSILSIKKYITRVI